jgi:hypothetical protein
MNRRKNMINQFTNKKTGARAAVLPILPGKSVEETVLFYQGEGWIINSYEQEDGFICTYKDGINIGSSDEKDKNKEVKDYFINKDKNIKAKSLKLFDTMSLPENLKRLKKEGWIINNGSFYVTDGYLLIKGYDKRKEKSSLNYSEEEDVMEEYDEEEK